ncbi:MAG TPA: 5-formyltetrahydrofolate cyclo-ligase [Candidatus Binatia bacterium]|nr:5-formyltetrahydrofolate cyclo-ligase [Candidatus Binatia bacterium]
MQRAVLEESKASLRRRLLAARKSISSDQRRLWSGLIQASALRFAPYLAATDLALYSPIDSEVETQAILAHALASKKAVYYPRIDPDNSAWFFQIGAETHVRPGRFGIDEPAGGLPLPVYAQDSREHTLIFVPGLGFDIGGHRLGRGGGAYDRMLTALKRQAISVGLAFELQILERLPTDEWDQKIHYVITEKRIIDCGASASRNRDLIVS